MDGYENEEKRRCQYSMTSNEVSLLLFLIVLFLPAYLLPTLRKGYV